MLHDFFGTQVRFSKEVADGHVHVRVSGALTFVGVPKLTAFLSTIPPGARVDVDLDVEVLDHAAFEALHAWRVIYEQSGGSVDMDQLHEAWTPNVSAGSRTRAA